MDVLRWAKLKSDTLNVNVNGLLGVVSYIFEQNIIIYFAFIKKFKGFRWWKWKFLCINLLLLPLQLICNLQRKFRFQLYTIPQNFTCTCVNATLVFALNGHEPKAKQYHQNCNSSESITDMTGSNRRFHTLIFSIWIQYVFSI